MANNWIDDLPRFPDVLHCPENNPCRDPVLQSHVFRAANQIDRITLESQTWGSVSDLTDKIYIPEVSVNRLPVGARRSIED